MSAPRRRPTPVQPGLTVAQMLAILLAAATAELDESDPDEAPEEES